MVVVTRNRGDNKEAMFRKFTRAFIEEDVVTDVRKKLFYKKPSKLKQEEAKERIARRYTRKRI